MLINCDNCPRRSTGCDGCMVAALYEPPAEVELLDRHELWAIETLTRAGFEVTLLDPRPVRAAPPVLDDLQERRRRRGTAA